MDEHFFKTTPSSIYLVKNDITLLGREVTFFKNNIILFFKRKYLMKFPLNLTHLGTIKDLIDFELNMPNYQSLVLSH